MRVITVRQPWAWAIVHGGKDVENRSRNIAGGYRGPVAIHAGLGWSEDGAADWNVRRAIMSADEGYDVEPDRVWDVGDYAEGIDPRFVRGAIIGTVEIADVHHCKQSTGRTTSGQPCCFKHGTPTGDTCSSWAMQPAPAPWWHIELVDPHPFAEPIPAKGRLGLWNPAPELAAQIEAAIENARALPANETKDPRAAHPQ